MTPRQSREPGTPPLHRLAAVAAVILVLALAGAFWAVWSGVDARFVERRMNGALAAATGLRVQMDSATVSPLRMRVRGHGVTVTPAGPEPRTRLRGEIPVLELSGLSPWSLVWKGDLEARRLVLRSPRLLLDGKRALSGDEDGETARAPPLDAERVRAPRLLLDRVVVEEGTVDLRGPAAGREGPGEPLGFLRGLLRGLRLTVEDVELGGERTGAGGSERLLGGRGLTATAVGYRAVSGDGFHLLSVRDVRLAAEEGTVSAREVDVVPTAELEALRGRGESTRGPRDRYHLALRSVAGRGLAAGAFLRADRLYARAVEADTIRLRIHHDARIPAEAEATRRPELLRLLADAPFPVRVDTVQVSAGTVRYEIRKEDAGETGRLTLEDASATATRLRFGAPPGAGDRGEAGEKNGPRIRASGRLEGAAPLHLDFRLRPRAAGLSFRWAGRLGSVDARTFNSISRPVAGFHIQSGQVDSITFDIRVADGVASGEVTPVYRDFGFKLEDPSDYGRGIDEVVNSFLAGLRAASDNQPGEDGSVRSGQVDHRLERGESLPSFLWKSLRSGLYDALGL